MPDWQEMEALVGLLTALGTDRKLCKRLDEQTLAVREPTPFAIA